MKKAVSPLIAVVLLMIFTIAVGMSISTWIYEYTKTTTTAADEGADGVISCANQIITISDVSLTDGGLPITQFNDTNTSDIFTSQTGGTYTKWVKIPKNQTITSAKITITGQPY